MLAKLKQNFISILLATMTIAILFDYFATVKKVEPLFCFKEEIEKFDDGEVITYTGLGYKIIKYNRNSYTKGFIYTHIFS